MTLWSGWVQRMICGFGGACIAWLATGHLLADESPWIRYAFPPEFPTSSVYGVTVDGQGLAALQTQKGAVLSFGMRGAVELNVRLPAAPRSVVVRPLSSGIQAVADGNGFRLNVPRPMNLSVEIDGNLDDPLFVFANPESVVPDRKDPKVKYFEGGKIHDVGEIVLKDGETLYLEGGAVVRGVVRALGASHVAVKGPGILDGGTRNHKTNMLVVRECRDVYLEDFILLDPFGWSMHLSGSQQVRLRNTHVIGWRDNSDGLDIEYSKDVQVDGCFWRTNDDCIAIKAIYPPGLKGVPFEEMIDPESIGGHAVDRVPGDCIGDIEIRNCVLWNDVKGQGFEIGFELRIDEIRGVRFHDSDIIHVLGGGAFTIHNGDQARIHDLVVENIRVEDTDRLIDFHVGLSIYSVDCPKEFHRSNPQRVVPPRRPRVANNPYQWFVPEPEQIAGHEAFRGSVEGVVFRNVRLLTPAKSGSMMNGFSRAKGISNVRFENLRIGDQRVDSAEAMGLQLDEHVLGVEFR